MSCYDEYLFYQGDEAAQNISKYAPNKEHFVPPCKLNLIKSEAVYDLASANQGTRAHSKYSKEQGSAWLAKGVYHFVNRHLTTIANILADKIDFDLSSKDIVIFDYMLIDTINKYVYIEDFSTSKKNEVVGPGGGHDSLRHYTAKQKQISHSIVKSFRKAGYRIANSAVEIVNPVKDYEHLN